jgi:trk system potassium uptake protein TrkA
MAQEYVVIGLGLFGRCVARQIYAAGRGVLAIDRQEDAIRELAAEFDDIVCADATNESALRELRLERMSCAVVAIGAESMESSILATTLLRQIGIPQIVARSLSELHGRVLRAVGAHVVVNPEQEMGERLARRLTQPNIKDRLDLGDNAELVELECPETFVGKSLMDLDVRRRHAISVVAIRRDGVVRASVDAGEFLQSGDVLFVLGSAASIDRLAARE